MLIPDKVDNFSGEISVILDKVDNFSGEILVILDRVDNFSGKIVFHRGSSCCPQQGTCDDERFAAGSRSATSNQSGGCKTAGCSENL